MVVYKIDKITIDQFGYSNTMNQIRDKTFRTKGNFYDNIKNIFLTFYSLLIGMVLIYIGVSLKSLEVFMLLTFSSNLILNITKDKIKPFYTDLTPYYNYLFLFLIMLFLACFSIYRSLPNSPKIVSIINKISKVKIDDYYVFFFVWLLSISTSMIIYIILKIICNKFILNKERKEQINDFRNKLLRDINKFDNIEGKILRETQGSSDYLGIYMILDEFNYIKNKISGHEYELDLKTFFDEYDKLISLMYKINLFYVGMKKRDNP
ncbi:hypothetical protein DY102_07165 [Apilactobacillus timberlakei]|uniref:hypothetical protein n=1 Tax=Apilactobacillus timberlakei TaxID=2008380 RepID=UPI00112C2687|nr:hypothetical protein [Apilactobacillus timberlakei]TPR21463.1 hypothetical protein DY102_07165 [Apilactobacillus timberlakei]